MSPHSLKVSVPSKTFLTGEYAVLKGYRALIMTHDPQFTCTLLSSGGDESKAVSFHPESPAGKLELELTGKQHKWNFDDPHKGAGGFGGSTAEYISVYKSLKPEGDVTDLSQKYYSLFQNKSNPPSGGDLVAQYTEEPSLHIFRKEPFETSSYSWPFDHVGVLILKTDTKLATHEHLENLKVLDFDHLGNCSYQVVDSLLTKDFNGFTQGIEAFTAAQSNLGLLSRQTEEILELFGEIPEIYAARGCGAMGADVVAVFVKKECMNYVWKQIDGLNKGLIKVTTR